MSASFVVISFVALVSALQILLYKFILCCNTFLIFINLITTGFKLNNQRALSLCLYLSVYCIIYQALKPSPVFMFLR
jgi:hypothetical protein